MKAQEIRFKGIRKDNGKLIEGFLVVTFNGRNLIIPPNSGSLHKSPYISYKYDVIPESVEIVNAESPVLPSEIMDENKQRDTDLEVEEIKEEGLKYLKRFHPDKEIDSFEGNEIFLDFAMGLQIGHNIAILKNSQLKSQKATPQVSDDRSNEMFLNMQYYMEYCQMKGYVTPKEWIEKHKHF
jgi:hypothetical protein